MAAGRAEMFARIGWQQTAEILALLVNINRDTQKHPQPVEAREFNPFEMSSERTPEDEAIVEKIEAEERDLAWCAKAKGRVVVKGKLNVVN